jgi:hypothetical protein
MLKHAHIAHLDLMHLRVLTDDCSRYRLMSDNERDALFSFLQTTHTGYLPVAHVTLNWVSLHLATDRMPAKLGVRGIHTFPNYRPEKTPASVWGVCGACTVHRFVLDRSRKQALLDMRDAWICLLSSTDPHKLDDCLKSMVFLYRVSATTGNEGEITLDLSALPPLNDDEQARLVQALRHRDCVVSTLIMASNQPERFWHRLLPALRASIRLQVIGMTDEHALSWLTTLRPEVLRLFPRHLKMGLERVTTPTRYRLQLLLLTVDIPLELGSAAWWNKVFSSRDDFARVADAMHVSEALARMDLTKVLLENPWTWTLVDALALQPKSIRVGQVTDSDDSLRPWRQAHPLFTFLKNNPVERVDISQCNLRPIHLLEGLRFSAAERPFSPRVLILSDDCMIDAYLLERQRLRYSGWTIAHPDGTIAPLVIEVPANIVPEFDLWEAEVGTQYALQQQLTIQNIEPAHLHRLKEWSSTYSLKRLTIRSVCDFPWHGKVFLYEVLAWVATGPADAVDLTRWETLRSSASRGEVLLRLGLGQDEIDCLLSLPSPSKRVQLLFSDTVVEHFKLSLERLSTQGWHVVGVSKEAVPSSPVESIAPVELSGRDLWSAAATAENLRQLLSKTPPSGEQIEKIKVFADGLIALDVNDRGEGVAMHEDMFKGVLHVVQAAIRNGNDAVLKSVLLRDGRYKPLSLSQCKTLVNGPDDASDEDRAQRRSTLEAFGLSRQAYEQRCRDIDEAGAQWDKLQLAQLLTDNPDLSPSERLGLHDLAQSAKARGGHLKTWLASPI